jgi:hypothetical protein
MGIVVIVSDFAYALFPQKMEEATQKFLKKFPGSSSRKGIQPTRESFLSKLEQGQGNSSSGATGVLVGPVSEVNVEGAAGITANAQIEPQEVISPATLTSVSPNTKDAGAATKMTSSVHIDEQGQRASSQGTACTGPLSHEPIKESHNEGLSVVASFKKNEGVDFHAHPGAQLVEGTSFISGNDGNQRLSSRAHLEPLGALSGSQHNASASLTNKKKKRKSKMKKTAVWDEQDALTETTRKESGKSLKKKRTVQKIGLDRSLDTFRNEGALD